MLSRSRFVSNKRFTGLNKYLPCDLLKTNLFLPVKCIIPCRVVCYVCQKQNLKSKKPALRRFLSFLWIFIQKWIYPNFINNTHSLPAFYEGFMYLIERRMLVELKKERENFVCGFVSANKMFWVRFWIYANEWMNKCLICDSSWLRVLPSGFFQAKKRKSERVWVNKRHLNRLLENLLYNEKGKSNFCL